MPVLSITTNSPVDSSPETLKKLSMCVAETLGKMENYVMVQLQHNSLMLFAGSDEPLAFVELKSIALPQENTSELSATLCCLISSEFNIPQNRIFIEFSDLQRHLFGWDGKTF